MECWTYVHAGECSGNKEQFLKNEYGNLLSSSTLTKVIIIHNKKALKTFEILPWKHLRFPLQSLTKKECYHSQPGVCNLMLASTLMLFK